MKQISNGIRVAAVLVVVMALGLVLQSCGGGGGGGGGGTPPPKPQLSGTVASGGAIIGATISLKDSAGTLRTATTDSNGLYSIDTTGLTPPYLLLATKSSNTLYSVSADTNTVSTANITPFTDLIIRTWYEVQNNTVEAAFTDPTQAGNEPPSPTVVAVISSVVKNLVQLWLNLAGVATDSFNLISTPFTADHTGIDKVLDQTTVDPSTGQIIISSGTVTQDSLLTAGTGSVTVVTTTTGTGGDSTSTGGTVVPVATAEQAALDGITTAVTAFATAVNLKSSTTLTASDILPFLDPSGIWGGLDQLQTAQQIAFFFNGSTISFSDIAIKALPTATTAETTFKLSRTKGGQTSTEPVKFFFTKPGSTWLMSGDNRIAEVEVRTAMVRSQGSVSSSPYLALEVNVNAPRAVSAPTDTSLIGATISGGPWSSVSLSYHGLNDAPWDPSLKTDSFGVYTFNPTIYGGELFTIGITPASGPTVTYTQILNAVTTEPIMITNLTGTTIAWATSGPKTVQWTLPKTFPIAFIRLGTSVISNIGGIDHKCDDAGSQVVLGITATQATNIIVPSQCDGADINWGEIYLQVYGINGELTQVYYEFQ